jgi:adenosylhomocysteine nucleosidase
MLRSLLITLAASWLLAAGPAAAQVLDRTPRTAVMTAMPTEMAVLRPALAHARRYRTGGIEFWTGELERRPVVLFLSGVSMTNAAMNTQLALDHFHIVRIVFSGVAGGVDPDLHVGDVVVPEAWGPYMESRFMREGPGGGFPPPADNDPAPYGMMFPHSEPMTGVHGPETRFWFPADPAMLAAARTVAEIVTPILERCTAAGLCIQPPRILVGGRGLSGPVFMDNAAYRTYLFSTFHAQAVDMETAAVAQVAYARGVPFIAFRSLSDLAGGDPGPNGFSTFVLVAADNAAVTLQAFLRALGP